MPRAIWRLRTPVGGRSVSHQCQDDGAQRVGSSFRWPGRKVPRSTSLSCRSQGTAKRWAWTKPLVDHLGPSLLIIPACGGLTVAKITGESAGATRFRSKAAYARWNGTAPVSGCPTTHRFRLNRGGNRQLNAALHGIVTGTSAVRHSTSCAGDSPTSCSACSSPTKPPAGTLQRRYLYEQLDIGASEKPAQRVPVNRGGEGSASQRSQGVRTHGGSRSAFYEWQRHRPTRREVADKTLGERIAEIHQASRSTYRWPRVHAQLRREVYHVAVNESLGPWQPVTWPEVASGVGSAPSSPSPKPGRLSS